MSQPWMKFYPSDWRADPALRMCSIGARGMWMEMLCLMHEANPRGFLMVKGKPVSDKQLASLAGAAPKETAGYIAELEDAGVFSRDDHGTIYSRRMRRDDEKAARDKANGRVGGNPALTGVNPPVNPTPNPPVNGGDKAQIPDTRSQKEGGGEASPRSGTSLIRPEAIALADEIGRLCGIDPKHPEPAWCGASMRVEAWLAQGWNPDAITIGVKTTLASRREVGPPHSIKYFEKAIARVVAEQDSPVPVATGQTSENRRAEISSPVSAAVRQNIASGISIGPRPTGVVDINNTRRRA